MSPDALSAVAIVSCSAVTVLLVLAVVLSDRLKESDYKREAKFWEGLGNYRKGAETPPEDEIEFRRRVQ